MFSVISSSQNILVIAFVIFYIDSLFSVFTAKYNRISTQFVRGLEQVIEWNAPPYRDSGYTRCWGNHSFVAAYQVAPQTQSNGVYASADNIWFDAHSIYELATEFAKRGGRWLYLDEVHKYPNWSQELKNIYDDLPDLHVVFTVSSLLQILNSRSGLSRHAVVYEMQGFSFREYLNWNLNLDLPTVSLHQLLTEHTEIAMQTLQKVKVLQHFDDYLQHSHYPCL